MTGDRVMDWDLDQWAEAQAWFERVYGWSPLPNLRGANEVWAGWINRRLDQPSQDVILVLDFDGWLKPTIARNRSWARRMFHSVMVECERRPISDAERELRRIMALK